MKRTVAALLDIEIDEATNLEFKIAVTRAPGVELLETMSFLHDGNPIEPREIIAEHGTRIHLLDCAPGKLIVSYDATLIGRAEPSSVSDYDVSKYLRPSRYAEADKFFGFVAGQFDLATPPAELLLEVTRWVSTHLSYVPGTSRGTDSAVDTLLAGAGVCRDYSHLTISLLRAVGIPARLVAVYAPGCDPMDFHAVVEASIDNVWRVVDATQLAPRSNLVRISTGRDAADTAFLDNHGGSITLHASEVRAVVEGVLDNDDYATLTSIG
ncbi:transglutaminase-like putative cysteine protease [Rhodococcus erythropolis]|uniref:transglutaminase-like domain-containing protein n=1 Tax=Rhodococcus erythropolis TaxID=1833 RepID=UPI00038E4F4C|nr:transglutaminase-like domain-containing protein [Rhodococcus erythropolis]EQM35074.1 transglutaminase [Rhodococcus erythropolis DN1]MBF7732972.1 transglutaminase domain-containing protein [Rhodococcus erythropolis]MCS4251797.1 transglutaminase-like putative cysteine protease [Rhodococcus erythropolis]MCW2426973.1 transglutaminase-like putative cysteine protease [Rhodococcus erythropolis]MCZ4641632.1 transglutaminase-like domain-containing protein [Rhodococcus erythropolis]